VENWGSAALEDGGRAALEDGGGAALEGAARAVLRPFLTCLQRGRSLSRAVMRDGCTGEVRARLTRPRRVLLLLLKQKLKRDARTAIGHTPRGMISHRRNRAMEEGRRRLHHVSCGRAGRLADRGSQGSDRRRRGLLLLPFRRLYIKLSTCAIVLPEHAFEGFALNCDRPQKLQDILAGHEPLLVTVHA